MGSGYICSEYKVLVLSTSTISQIVLLTYYVRQPRKAKISMKSAQWYFVSQIVLTYSEKKKCSNVFENLEWRPRIGKTFEITRTVYSNSERSEQFLKQNAFLTCSWRFLRSNKWEQLESNWKKLLGFRNMQEKLEKTISYFFKDY